MQISSKDEVEEVFLYQQTLKNGDQGAEQKGDFQWQSRLWALKQATDARDGGDKALVEEDKFSAQFVIQQAAERFFLLIDFAIRSLGGIFSESDLGIVLNTTCGPIWLWDTQSTVAAMVADDNGIERFSDLDEDSDLRRLLEKLMKLTPLQDAALVDLCERFWRGKNVRSIAEKFQEMGLTVLR